MIKNIIIFSALTFSAIAAIAGTRYEDTLAMYNAGSYLPAETLQGAYSGRCFYNQFKKSAIVISDIPTGALLTGKDYSNDDAGPEFSAKTRLIVNLANAVNDNDVTYRFDNWTEKQALESMSNNSMTSTAVQQDGISQTWKTNYGNGAKGEFSARSYKDYIVVKATSLLDGHKLACYFYKKLQ